MSEDLHTVVSYSFFQGLEVTDEQARDFDGNRILKHTKYVRALIMSSLYVIGIKAGEMTYWLAEPLHGSEFTHMFNPNVCGREFEDVSCPQFIRDVALNAHQVKFTAFPSFVPKAEL